MVRRGHRLAVRPEAATEEEAEVEAPERERESILGGCAAEVIAGE